MSKEGAGIMVTKITAIETRQMRSLTMGCWWPSKINGQAPPDWSGIAGELIALTNDAENRIGTPLSELNELRCLRQLARDRARGY